MRQQILDTGLENFYNEPKRTPGSCTAIVRGVNNTTGIALVEVYDLP